MPLEDRVDGDWRITRRNMTVAVAAAGFNLGVYEKWRALRRASTMRCTETGIWSKRLRPPVMFSTPDAGAATD